MVLDWGFRCLSKDRHSTNKCIYAFSFLVGKHREPESINAKLFLPIIPIAIVEYALYRAVARSAGSYDFLMLVRSVVWNWVLIYHSGLKWSVENRRYCGLNMVTSVQVQAVHTSSQTYWSTHGGSSEPSGGNQSSFVTHLMHTLTLSSRGVRSVFRLKPS